MLPSWIPERLLLVYVTGIFEFAIAIGFLLPRLRLLSGWAAAVALVLCFPVNIYAALHRIPKGGHTWGPTCLLIRAPLQTLTVFWVYWCAIRQPDAVVGVDEPGH